MNELVPSQKMVAFPTMRLQLEWGAGKLVAPTVTVEYTLTPGATKSTWMHLSISVIARYKFAPLITQPIKLNNDWLIKSRIKLAKRQVANYMAFALKS